jgi:sugar phosphate isomerase/epimerase
VGLDIPTLRAHEETGFHPSGVAELLRESGIGCFELVPLSITDDRGSTRQALAEVTYFAPRVGARTVLAVARGPLTTALVDSARTCTETLAEIGVSLAVEFLPGIELNSIDSVRRLADAVSMPTLRVMVDSWHFFVGPSTWESLDNLPCEQLGFVQFSDAAPRQSDDLIYEYRHRRVLPGEGVHDLQRFADIVKRKSANVTVSVEVLSESWRECDPAALARASLAATRPFWE